MKPAFLQTTKKESFATWKFRTLMNWYPMYFGTGGKILFWASDSSELHITLRLNMWTYNYVGTIFGGSMFAASDPFYMLMLFRSLGKNYVVWDKSASIKFKKPGKSTLYAKYMITEEDLIEIKKNVAEKGETTRTFTIHWMDKNQVVHAEIERLCYIADKSHYQNKKGATQSAKLEFKLSKVE
jgi:acyl-coenzyme A thioesterase PaaI-like protein